MVAISQPGVYEIDEAEYHADPCTPELGRSLSVSGAKKLLPPSCPAVFQYERENGRASKKAFDFGHAAHGMILGTGLELVSIDAEDWRTKAAREKRDAAYAAGRCPLLVAEADKARAVTEAVRSHPVASAILSDGKPEQSIFFTDSDTGITRRSRIDWLRQNAIVDLKTCIDASPAGFAKACANYGYPMQAAWYGDAAESVGLGRLPFIFIAVEKEPPYLVAVYQLDPEAERIGAQLNRQAIGIYALCESMGEWPGYSNDIETLSLPAWYARANLIEDNRAF